jgi:hypothetical protein
VYPVEHYSWDALVNESANPSSESPTRQGHDRDKSFYLNSDNPLSTTLRLDLSPSKVMKGGFKIAALGTSTTRLFKSNTAEICAKRTYHSVEHVVEQNGSFVTKSDAIPYEGRKQFQNLSMEIACTVWAQALLDLVYKFISQEDSLAGCCPLNIQNSVSLSWLSQWRVHPMVPRNKMVQFSWSKKLLPRRRKDVFGNTSTTFLRFP